MATKAKRSGSRRRSSLVQQTRQRVRQERRALYRQLTSEAAERVFAEKGSGASRMQEIATEAGLSLATIYDVVDGKEALVASIHEWRMRDFLDRIRAAREQHSGTLETHLAVLLDGASFFLEHPYFLRLCCRDGYGWASQLPVSTRGAKLWNECASIPRDLFARGIVEGIYVDDDPELLVRKMLALKQVELSHWADQGMETLHEVVLDRLQSQFIRAFCTRDS